MEKYDCVPKLVAQCYDSAAVMAGELNGLQKQVKDKYPDALYIHCLAHRLNLVLSQSVSCRKECKIFFMTLSSFASFFSNSTKRTAALDETVRRRFPKVCPTRWNYIGRLVETVRKHKGDLSQLFEEILDNPDKWDSQTYHEARGFSNVLQEFEFEFLLHIFGEVFSMTDVLFDILQTKVLDVSFCMAKLIETKSFIRRQRDEFEKVWAKCEKNVEAPKKRRRGNESLDIRAQYRRLYYEIHDVLYQQLELRFAGLEKLKFLQLFAREKNRSSFPEEAFRSL